MKNDRLHALRILLNLVENGQSLSQGMQNAEISPLTRAICFGVCRHYFRLQLIADQLLKKRPETLDIWLLILIGLFQLQYLNKPEYATVKETVALLDKLKKSWAKGLLNAVLRRFCRERMDILAQLERKKAFIDGHPAWLVKRIQQDWPEHCQAILQANDNHPPLTLRVNKQQISRDDYLNLLLQSNIEAEAAAFSEVGVRLLKPMEVPELPGYAQGFFSVQDQAAQTAVSLLDLHPGLSVLDACCAPGGKTCHILESEPSLERCIAIDMDLKRLGRVQDNLERLQLSATVLHGDVLTPQLWWDGQQFDRILLDAPCSATGVIRRHPDIKIIRTEADIHAAAALQSKIIRSLWPLLKAGGRLVYATCSIMKEENEQLIEAFSLEHDACRLENIHLQWGIAGTYGWQILPGQQQCDGFFYSVLHKV